MGMMGGERLPSVKVLAEELGFDVSLELLPSGVRGRLERDPFAQNGYRIVVNSADDVIVRRWTVLHELVHYFLHRRDDPFAAALHRAGSGYFYDEDELKEEREANEFTEALVFGDGRLEAAVGLWGSDTERLSRYLGVSEAAVKIALKKLKI
jgi:Zn-dependent peptidase ImmA (M78 family)